jgi:hypothetical protein
VPLVVDKLASHLIAAVDPGRKKPGGPVPDLVVAIDDLELYNLDQPEIVTAAFRDAIRRRVPSQFSSLDRQLRCFEQLKERASFHLLCPMLEAYFFTCPASLEAAAIQEQYFLVADKDVEDFESIDARYLSKFEDVPHGNVSGEIHPQTQRWYKKHPKQYLQHLIAGPDVSGPIYRETKQGAAALSVLSHRDVLATATQRTFVRSLIYDLADKLDQPLPVGDLHPATYQQTSKDRVLRNI